MKKKPLTPEQFQQLLIATANLPFIRQQRQPTSYLSDVLETVLNFQMQEPVVVKALQYFEHNVQHQHDIHTHEQLQDALNIYPDTEEGNKAAAQFFWGNKHWTRIELLRRFLPFLASIGVTDQPSLRAWAKQADFERDFKGRVKGMGIAVFHWLLLRCGVSTIKPDVWVINFGQRVLGKRIPEDRLVTAFNDIAPLIGESLETLDVTIWYFEKMNMATADEPALREVWWRTLADELVKQQAAIGVTGPSSTDSPDWQIELDEAQRLRHDAAGITLTPKSLWVSSPSAQAMTVRLAQSIWYEGFALTLTVTTDRALRDECFVQVACTLTSQKWEVSNSPVFKAWLEVEDSVLVPPQTLVDELRAWAAEVAERVVAAVETVAQTLRLGTGEPTPTVVGPPSWTLQLQSTPHSLTEVATNCATASNEDAFESHEVSFQGEPPDNPEGMGIHEYLGWMVARIDEHHRAQISRADVHQPGKDQGV